MVAVLGGAGRGRHRGDALWSEQRALDLRKAELRRCEPRVAARCEDSVARRLSLHPSPDLLRREGAGPCDTEAQPPGTRRRWRRCCLTTVGIGRSIRKQQQVGCEDTLRAARHDDGRAVAPSAQRSLDGAGCVGAREVVDAAVALRLSEHAARPQARVGLEEGLERSHVARVGGVERGDRGDAAPQLIGLQAAQRGGHRRR